MSLASFISPILSPITANLTTVLAGALAISVVGNVGLGWFAKHEYDLKQKVVTVEKIVQQQAEQHKATVEHEDDEVTASVQAGTTSELDRDIASLRLRRPPSSVSNLPAASQGAQGSTSDPTSSVVLPSTQWIVTEADEESCVQWIDIAKGWQSFYSGTEKVSNDNGDNQSSSDPSSAAAGDTATDLGISPTSAVRAGVSVGN